MLEAGMGGAGPDAIAEAKLLDALQADEFRRADQIELQRAEGDGVVEAVADDGARRIIGQGRRVDRRGVPEGRVSGVVAASDAASVVVAPVAGCPSVGGLVVVSSYSTVYRTAMPD